MRSASTLWYIAFGIIVVMIGALAGVYVYLYSKGSDTSTLLSSRGLLAPIPSFPGTNGSTAGNIASSSSAASSSAPQAPDQLWHVSKSPTAGMAFVQQSSSTDLVYADRATGYLYEANVTNGSVTRLTNTLHAKTYKAVFPGDGEVIEETVQGGAIVAVASTFATLESASSSLPLPLSTINVDFPVNLRSIIPAAGGLVMISGNPVQGATGWVSNWNGTGERQVFASPIIDWQPLFFRGTVGVVEKPADDLPGYAYTFGKGGQTFLMGPMNGLGILPHPTSQALLFSASQGGTVTLGLQVGNSAPVPLSLHTVVDKCVWMPGTSLVALCAVPTSVSGQFIDSWYQGKVHTNDTWWRINASAGSAEEFFTPNVSLDVINPVIDPSGNYVAFLNNADQSLWVLRMTQ